MTTPLSSDSSGEARPANAGADAPTEDFSANPLPAAAMPTETVPTHPTEPYPQTAPLPENDSMANFFTPNTEVPHAAPTAAARLRPRFGTIFWGILLLAFAAYMVVFTLLPAPPDPTLWLLGGVIAVGLGLVVAGIAAIARRAD